MAEKITVEFPHVINVELPHDKPVVAFVNSNRNVVREIISKSHRGVTHRDGNWRLDPGWIIEKQGTGKYKITHNLGYDNTSLSISLLVQPGSFSVLEHSSTYFVVETTLDRKPMDLDFSFTLTRAISQPAPAASQQSFQAK